MANAEFSEVIEIKAPNTGPTVLVIAGVHGDEYEPMLAALGLKRMLADRLSKGIIRILPVANRSAYEATSRYGSDGKDMARICPGNKAGTETERAAAQVCSYILNADYLIDMHTGGVLYDIFPMVGYALHPEKEVLEKQQEMANATGLPMIWGTDSRPNGRTLSVARDRNIPAVYFEFGGGTGFRQHVVNNYQTAVEGILAMLGMLGTSLPSMDRFTYWFEDNRPDSGHFQSKMPAPMDGIFIAKVAVGDPIEAEQTFGEIFNPISGERCELKAPVAGIVHFLRVVVKVQKGDALGGVLPVQYKTKVVINE